MSCPKPTTAAAFSFDEELLMGSFVQVPIGLLRCPRITVIAKALYALLLSYAYEQRHESPRQSQLCADLGIGERTLRSALGDLESAGLVKTLRGGDGAPATYHVLKWTGKETPPQVVATGHAVRSRPAKSAGSEPHAEQHSEPARTAGLNAPLDGADRQETQGLKYSDRQKVQDLNISDRQNTQGLYRKGRDPLGIEAAAAVEGESIDDGVGEDIAAAAVVAGAVEGQDSGAASAAASTPSPPAQPTQAGPVNPVERPLLDLSPEELIALSPEALLRRFKTEHPNYAERIKAKRATARLSPVPLLQRCILETWLPELREARAARAAREARAAMPARSPTAGSKTGYYDPATDPIMQRLATARQRGSPAGTAASSSASTVAGPPTSPSPPGPQPTAPVVADAPGAAELAFEATRQGAQE